MVPSAYRKKADDRDRLAKVSANLDSSSINSSLKKSRERKYYHCHLLNKETNQMCGEKKICSTNIWRHVASKKHLGPQFKKEQSLPTEVKLCMGEQCKICSQSRSRVIEAKPGK